MLRIDGSQGEGGGQMLRSALALSLVTGTPFRIEHIRARRSRPGLLRQHLTAVQAAAAIGNAGVSGAELRSQTIEFRPRGLHGGAHVFDIGSAGSACLVLQAVLPALLQAPSPSSLRITGGTHVTAAPVYDYLERVFVPLLKRMGASIELELVRPGFLPAGDGVLSARIEPARKLRPLELIERGKLRKRSATVWIAHLPQHVADRELACVAAALGWSKDELQVREDNTARSAGNCLVLEVESTHVTEAVSEIGTRGRPAERVADAAIAELRTYLDGDAPVGSHLADQLLIPFALAGEGAFRATAFSEHARTNRDIIERFLPVHISETDQNDGTIRVEVTPAA